MHVLTKQNAYLGREIGILEATKEGGREASKEEGTLEGGNLTARLR